MKRRIVLSSLVAFSAPVLSASTAKIPLAVSMADELAGALRAKAPLLVMVSLDGCAYCMLVREQHLGPMLAQGGQPVVQVDMRSNTPLVDFAGQRRTHDDLVRSWRVDAAPTLLFFGRQGREIAPRLRGASIPDFYGAYLEERIQIARRELAR